ncbi:MAG: RNA chaperone Hfq [Candidatus Acidiferrales bacterium]
MPDSPNRPPGRGGPPGGGGPPNRERDLQNIQDGFLNGLRRDRVPVNVFLTSGVKLSGRIKSFDKFSLLLESDGGEQLVFKHAIATVSAAKASGTPPAKE